MSAKAASMIVGVGQSALGSALVIEKSNGKNRSSANSVKRTKRSAAKSRTRTIAVAGNNVGNSETKEERERRLAKREAPRSLILNLGTRDAMTLATF